jgi:YbbR domain-containing protein
MSSAKLSKAVSGTLSRFVRWLGLAFTANLGLKGLSLLFALGLVAYQRSQQDVQQVTVPVSIVLRLPSETARRELKTSMPANVYIAVRGESRAIDAMKNGVPPVELDLRDGKVDKVDFRADMFAIPNNVEITNLPETIQLEWEDVIAREVPIQATIAGKVAEGYETTDVSVEPKSIVITGPRTDVSTVQFARLMAFDISGQTDGEYRQQIGLEPAPTRVKYATTDPVSVTVRIRRRLVHENFPNLSVEIVGISGARAKPSLVDVTVHGPPEVVAGLRKALLVPQVDLRAVTAGKPHGSALVPVKVELAKAEAEVQPPSVVVTW